MTTQREDPGQTTVLIVGMTLVAGAVFGFAIDGTRAFLMRRSLQNAADGAATAASAELDQTRYYASGGRTVVLDPAAAQSTATRWLAQRSLDATAHIDIAPDAVVVTLRAEVPTMFLGIVGIRSVPVGVDARAEPVTSGVNR